MNNSIQEEIIFVSLVFLKGESVSDVVIGLIDEKLKIKVRRDDIDTCHRLSMRDGAARPIIVKFCRRSVRNEVYRAKPRLKNSKIVIREDLTKDRLAIVKHLLEKYGKRNVFTENCNVFYKFIDKIAKVSSIAEMDFN